MSVLRVHRSHFGIRQVLVALSASITLLTMVSPGSAQMGSPFARSEAGLTSYGQDRPYFENDDWRPLLGKRTVMHCASYGCRTTKRFTFTQADMIELSIIMSDALAVPGAGSAAMSASDGIAAEREAMKRAIAWMEVRVGAALGTDRDRASIGFLSAGQASQQDCVDEARNAAAYLYLLHAHGLIRHHSKPIIVSRGNMLRGAMTHYGVLMREVGTGRVWAVDSGVGANGAPPRIEPAQRWFARGRSRMPERLYWGGLG